MVLLSLWSKRDPKDVSQEGWSKFKAEQRFDGGQRVSSTKRQLLCGGKSLKQFHKYVNVEFKMKCFAFS